MERHDIGFTLKAESTCYVLNWQPLNLEDLERFEEMGGSLEKIIAHTDCRQDADNPGDHFDGKSSETASTSTWPEICFKAFAYSR